MDCSALPSVTRSLSLLFTDDTEIHVLNREYRGKDKPTDVLSFSQLEGGNKIPSPSLGDLVISLDTTLKQSKKYRVTLSRELLRLLVHGTLHLFGYDHEKVPAAEAAKMRRLEKFLMAQFPRNPDLIRKR
ncbi:MAG: rRNA maturation RNase YbeY [Deltaproteobacteria bacterium]|nr:rRNA maturation RNase YbeY [Deltaproteobacteria bacterium]